MSLYPDALASQVFSRLSEGFFRHGFLAQDDLQKIIDECFFASLEQEEGEDLTVNICVMDKAKSLATANEHNFVALPFAKQRPLSGSELAKLAPAVDPQQSCVCVWTDDDGELVIWGVVIFGRAWSNWHKFGETPQVSGPTRLIVSVKARGHLVFSAGFIKLLEYQRGAIVDQGVRILVGDGPVKKALANIFKTPIHPELGHDTILAWMLDRMIDGAHGGAIIAAAPGDVAAIRERCELKYRIHPERGAGRIVRSSLDELMHYLPPEQRADPSTLIDTVQAQCRDQENDYIHIREYADALAAMAQVDGALVITDRFRPVGFSARIMNWSSPEGLLHAHDLAATRCEPYDLKKLGTRHGSAAYLAAACPGVIIFVVSQDGHVSVMLGEAQRSLVWRKVDPTLGFAF